jgi:hypothetical protein
MSVIRADVCDNAGSDMMCTIRISWRIVVVVVVVVAVNDGAVKPPKARCCERNRGYSWVRGVMESHFQRRQSMVCNG